jgi:hypothetical protein
MTRPAPTQYGRFWDPDYYVHDQVQGRPPNSEFFSSGGRLERCSRYSLSRRCPGGAWLDSYRPSQFLAADHYGGFTVGLVVIFIGVRVLRDTSLDLMDTMPTGDSLEQIRLSVPGVLGVEKCFARKTGLQHHVDLHLEVDPNLTVWESHDIATLTRIRLREQLSWIADVLVHVEPAPGLPRHPRSRSPGQQAPVQS